MVYLANPPETAALADEHAWTPSMEQERRERHRREPVLHGVQRAVRAAIKPVKPQKWRRMIAAHLGTGDVLDIGCGTGHRLGECLDRGLIQGVPTGIEIEPPAAREASRRYEAYGGRVIIGPAAPSLDTLAPASCAGAHLYAYLEHETEPASVLGKLLRVLIPGARVVIKVPNHASLNRRVRGRRWCGYRHPDHVNYFTPRTLGLMVRDAGFEIHRFGVLDRFPLNDSMWLVARKPEPPARA